MRTSQRTRIRSVATSTPTPPWHRAVDWTVDRLLGLPPARTPQFEIERDLPVAMPDGVRLLADRYHAGDARPRPVVLLRCPYGRGSPYSTIFARPLARHGFQVVLQSVRGTFGSGGTFHPFRDEQDDGVATVRWLRAQPWCDGRVAAAGVSYLGYTQWALAPHVDPPLRAIALAMSPSKFHLGHLTGGAFPLHTALSWAALLDRQEDAALVGLLPNLRRDRRERRAMTTLPLRRADRAAAGRDVDAWADLVNHSEPGDAYWDGTDHSGEVQQIDAPVSLLTGWYDAFLPQQLADFGTLSAAGTPVRVTIGPWGHDDLGVVPAMVADQYDWLSRQLADPPRPHGTPRIRALVQHDGWRTFGNWPPAGTRRIAVYLADRRRLAARPPEADVDTFDYLPRDPTPTVGGPLITGRNKQRRNSALERRADTLVFTGRPLRHDVDVVGHVRAVVYLHTSRQHADLFVRLCDVDRLGVSRNVCDGIHRLRPGDPAVDGEGIVVVEVELWPTAYRFRRGHRLRVMLSGGAFPRYARNHGSDEPVADAVAATPVRFTIHHDPAHPSRVELPWLPHGGRR